MPGLTGRVIIVLNAKLRSCLSDIFNSGRLAVWSVFRGATFPPLDILQLIIIRAGTMRRALIPVFSMAYLPPSLMRFFGHLRHIDTQITYDHFRSLSSQTLQAWAITSTYQGTSPGSSNCMPCFQLRLSNVNQVLIAVEIQTTCEPTAYTNHSGWLSYAITYGIQSRFTFVSVFSSAEETHLPISLVSPCSDKWPIQAISYAG